MSTIKFIHMSKGNECIVFKRLNCSKWVVRFPVNLDWSGQSCLFLLVEDGFQLRKICISVDKDTVKGALRNDSVVDGSVKALVKGNNLQSSFLKQVSNYDTDVICIHLYIHAILISKVATQSHQHA